jgi:hypothetical protein
MISLILLKKPFPTPTAESGDAVLQFPQKPKDYRPSVNDWESKSVCARRFPWTGRADLLYASHHFAFPQRL